MFIANSERNLPRREVENLFDYKTSMITDEHPLRGLLFY